MNDERKKKISEYNKKKYRDDPEFRKKINDYSKQYFKDHRLERYAYLRHKYHNDQVYRQMMLDKANKYLKENKCKKTNTFHKTKTRKTQTNNNYISYNKKIYKNKRIQTDDEESEYSDSMFTLRFE